MSFPHKVLGTNVKCKSKVSSRGLFFVYGGHRLWAGFLHNGANYAIFVEVRRYNGDLLAQEGFYPTANSIGRTRILSNIDTGTGAGGGTGKATYTDGVHIQIRDHHSGKTSAIYGIAFAFGLSAQNQVNF